MKNSLLSAAALFLCLFSSASAEDFDARTDQRMLSYIHSSEFCNTVIYYPYAGKKYSLRIIHNPTGKKLWGMGLSSPRSWELAIVGNLPSEAAEHLEILFPELQEKNESHYIELRGSGELSNVTLASLHPVHIAEQIDDQESDTCAQEVFASNEFAVKVLFYHLDDTYYRVKLLHNPKGDTYTATKEFRLEQGGQLHLFTIQWGWKYGIVVDKEAPQSLIDHLSRLTNPSWKDWYWNFKICNGTYVQHTAMAKTCDLDTWFNITFDLKLE